MFFRAWTIFLNRPLFHLALIALLGLIAYSNTSNVPFQWDDQYFISGNPIVKDLGYFFEPSKAKGLGEFYGAVKSRYVGYLSFALNYKFGGLDVRGYHVVNIAIHILNAMLVYFLVALTFRTPFMQSSNPPSPPFAKGGLGGVPNGNPIALFSALLFVSHPVQTEAVTYIFQRLASLMAFFYFLALVLYIKWRLTPSPTPLPQGRGLINYPPFSKGGRGGIFLYLLSLLSAVLAMKTKENAFTLPVMIALYESFFFSGPVKKRLLWLTPFLLTMLIIPLTLIGVDKPIGEVIGDAASLGSGDAGMSRWDYLFTQFRVIGTYIRLLFLPINQNIFYDYPASSSFLEPRVLLSCLFLFSIIIGGIYLFNSSKDKPKLRIVSFGIFWFFIALSVESGIIPIPMVINEYRVYLPSVGAFLSVACGLFIFLGALKSAKARSAIYSLIVLLPLALSYMAYSRNAVWESWMSLWQDVVKKSPRLAKGHYNLANEYQSKNMPEDALREYLAVIALEPGHGEAHNNLASLYMKTGRIDDALKHYLTASGLRPHNAAIWNNLGRAYAAKGRTDEAIEHYRLAIEIDPSYEEARYNLGVAYGLKGQADSAIEELNRALELKPGSADTLYNLGVAYYMGGFTDKAIGHIEEALKLDPYFAEAHQKLGLIYLKEGRAGAARAELEKALSINSDLPQAGEALKTLDKKVGN